jgi:hypothetical protein
LPAVISAWPVMNTAISRATSSPGAAPRLTVQAPRKQAAGDNGLGLGRWRSWSPGSMTSSCSPNSALIIVFRRNLIVVLC